MKAARKLLVLMADSLACHDVINKILQITISFITSWHARDRDCTNALMCEHHVASIHKQYTQLYIIADSIARYNWHISSAGPHRAAPHIPGGPPTLPPGGVSPCPPRTTSADWYQKGTTSGVLMRRGGGQTLKGA